MDRYFLLPRVGTGASGDSYRPGYIDGIDGIEKWAGQDVDMTDLDFGLGLDGVYFIVRVYGTSQALSELMKRPDTRVVGEGLAEGKAAAALAIGAGWEETLEWDDAKRTLEVR